MLEKYGGQLCVWWIVNIWHVIKMLGMACQACIPI